MIIIETEPKPIPVYMSPDEARLFLEFQKRYAVVAPIVGYLDAMHLKDISNSQIILDMDEKGTIKHCAITKHYRM